MTKIMDFTKDFIKQQVEDTMQVYKTAFEEGRKVGFQEGYLKGVNECKKIVDKTLSPNQSQFARRFQNMRK